MANVVMKNINKVYDKNITAVDDFNLDIADKEFVVLVGPSGCGKSTTLRMVAGLEEITGGELFIDGKLVNGIPPKDRDIAMVFQNYALYPHMSVFENMAFALKLRKIPKKEIEQKVGEAAKILGITDLLRRKPKALSGGQRQRVAIGRAIVREPKVFLMDEPLSNLDAKLRSQMRAELIKLRQRIDTTFIYVTHDQTEAMTLGDRIVVMKGGFVQQIGTPLELYNRPANLFVAGFIGTPQMNFLPAELVLKGEKYAIVCNGIKIDLPDEKQDCLLKDNTLPGEIILGIRPEHISIVSENVPGAMKAKVDVSEMMGSEIYMHVNIGGTDIVLRVPVQGLENYPIISGSENYLWLKVHNRQMHLFDMKTEKILI
jgi:multiple sugar transport system ATP-binding protein